MIRTCARCEPDHQGLDELDTHVPLLISAPWIHNASKGLSTTAFAEAVGESGRECLAAAAAAPPFTRCAPPPFS